jgi:hypothetical protein
MTTSTITRLAFLGAACLAQASWAAELGRTQIPSGAVMVSACAGQRSGGGTSAGDLGYWSAGASTCNASQSSVPGTTLSESASYTNPQVVVAESSAAATMGQMKLYANFNANNQLGVGAWATAGWVDTLTVNAVDPAQQGKQAIMTFSLHVGGTLVGQPMGNSGVSIEVSPYINDSFIGLPEASYSGQQFKVAGQGQGGFPYNETVNSNATFQAVITLGTPFELGIFGRATAGVASVGPNWYSASTSDFDQTITWQGVQGVTVLGNNVPVSIQSLSGTAWQGSYAAPVPEASSWLLALAGLLTTCLVRSRMRLVPRQG